MTRPCPNEEHDKCYSSLILCSNPPQYPWICRRCGAEGRDSGTLGVPTDEYETRKRQKARGQDQAVQGV